MYRVAYMYVPPPPPRRTRSCLVPPPSKSQRRQPAEDRQKASDQDVEGIISSTQEVCIVTYVSSTQVTCIVIYIIKCASGVHCYLYVRLPVSSYKVCNVITLLVSCQVRKLLALLPMVSITQEVCIVGNLSSMQCDYIVGNLSSMQCDYIVGIVSSMQVTCIVIYGINYADYLNTYQVRNMLTILHLCHIFYIAWNDSTLTFTLTRCVSLFYFRNQGNFWDDRF